MDLPELSAMVACVTGASPDETDPMRLEIGT